MRSALIRAAALSLALASPVGAQQPAGRTVVLDTSGHWRIHYTLRAPVLLAGGNPRTLGILSPDTPPPPKGWTLPDFDDSRWLRQPGVPFPTTRMYQAPLEMMDTGFTVYQANSPITAMMCLRGKFKVTDPAAAGPLRLALAYRGGAVVYLNGREIARGHLPAAAGPSDPAAPAEPYELEAYLRPDGELLNCWYRKKVNNTDEIKRRWQLHIRRIEAAIPAAALRKGTNVLAVEVHRAPHREVVYQKTRKLPAHMVPYSLWSTCDVVSARLEADKPDGIEPNASRPKGFQVWNSPPLHRDFDLDYGDPNEPLRPVRIVTSRGGCGSGKVVVGSDAPVEGLKASLSDFAGPGGSLPASAGSVRFALPNGWAYLKPGRYPTDTDLFDGLADSPPARVEVRRKKILKGHWIRPGQPEVVFGATQPVWVTVAVPAEARAGDYKAALTVSAQGVEAVRVPVELKVCRWRVPPPREFHTVVDLVQSPESVAMHYGVPLYGEEHFRLLGKSMDRLGYVGNWSLYVPLICHTNQGNEQSMVRWVRQADPPGFRFDFAVFDRYLDLAEKHMGKPRILCLFVWDLFIGGKKSRHEDAIKYGHQALGSGGVPVSLLDPASGKVSTLELGPYGDPKDKPAWQALAKELRRRLAKRGLSEAALLGMGSDGRPSPEIAAFFAELLPKMRWMRHGHQYWRRLGRTGSDIGFQATVVWMKYLADPAKGEYSCYGWKRPENHALYFRTYQPNCPMLMSRLLCEFNIQGNQRGFGRIGLDFWPVVPDARWKRKTPIVGRYPKSSWRQLNAMVGAFVPPGADGACASHRLEMMREGLQECEARIFIERALTDEALAARLGKPLAERCRKVLDERARAMMVNLQDLQQTGFERRPRVQLSGAEYGFNYNGRAAELFFQWFPTTAWQERTARLYSAAADVAAALKGKGP